MKLPRLPRTVFGRLVLLVLALLLASHALTFVLLQWHLHQGPPLPPPPPAPPLWFWIGMLAQAALAALAVALGSRMLSRPFEQLAQAADALQFDHGARPLPLQGPTEARQAAARFNEMQGRLQQQAQERRTLLAGIAHDLRGPLARLHLRLQAEAGPPDLDRLRTDAEEMRQLLALSLDVLAAPGAPLQRRLVDLGALAQALIDDLEERHPAARGRLSCAGQVAPAAVDPLALRRALGNLIENAWRHGGGGLLALHDGPDGAVQIEISDRGPGLAEELLDQVLKPYAQGPAASPGGWGLGLAIAHQIALAHGGSLRLLAREGGGLTVRLSLPRVPAGV